MGAPRRGMIYRKWAAPGRIVSSPKLMVCLACYEGRGCDPRGVGESNPGKELLRRFAADKVADQALEIFAEALVISLSEIEVHPSDGIMLPQRMADGIALKKQLLSQYDLLQAQIKEWSAFSLFSFSSFRLDIGMNMPVGKQNCSHWGTFLSCSVKRQQGTKKLGKFPFREDGTD
ncbi:hypothetical protein ZIOFF_062165 [Zingiber officinale]|uniref:Uncharacterized protein n=1 Tax=Zingiber officinale TaxID=94328 RepID=A0A8J5KAL0_ZINOF|nr:hypothetical protein ZIOFF_062165 [Zingiber officinale]